MKKSRYVLLVSFLGFLPMGCGSNNGGTSPSPLTWNQITIADRTAGVDTSSNGYIVLANFNHDNLLDAASGFASSQSVVLHIQSGTHTWTSNIIASNLGAVRSLATADLDNSGQPDIVAATGSGNVWILLAPAFSGPNSGPWNKSALANPVLATSWNDVKIAQFDNISQFQIVATSSASGVIVLWRAETLVSSAANYKPFVINTRFTTGFERLAVADVDGDGDLDIVALGPSAGVIWLENLGGANLVDPWPAHPISSLMGLTRLVIGDLEKNNRANVIAVNPTSRQVLWFENSGSPRTDDAWPQHLIATLASGAPDALSIGDMDNDSSVDLLVGTKGTDQSIFWLRQFNDPRALWQVQLVAKTGFDVGELPVGNIDNTNGLDFATTLAGSATPVVWFQQQ